MFFNIDGEIYPCDGVHIQLIPSWLTLIGKPYSLTSEWQNKKPVMLKEGSVLSKLKDKE